MPEDEPSIEGRDIDEEEPQLKTPPPESGRQHVTPSPSIAVSEAEEDIAITVTMEESEAPPPISPSPPEASPLPMIASGLPDIPEVAGPQPRLALVSEPEIELHGMTPLSSTAEPIAPAALGRSPSAREPAAHSTPGGSFRPQDIELSVPVPPAAPSLPSAAPSGIRPVPAPAPVPPAAPTAAAPPAPTSPGAPFARTAPSVPDTKPSVSAPTPTESPAPPPVRLMTQPLADASGRPAAPVEVWASTFSPAALRGHVASFVGQNANSEPKTFGELVRASIALGEDDS